MKMTPTAQHLFAYIVSAVFFFGVVLMILRATNAEAKPLSSEINVPNLCEAIKDVENTSQYCIGAAGERSAWQIKQEVWEAHSKKPFWWASVNGYPHLAETKRVVVLHVLWIRRRIGHLGLEDSPHDIALVYKAGYGRVMAKKSRLEDKDYAQRVANIYYDTP